MSRKLNIAIIYDRVFPASYGGAERWYRLLAESLVAAGHHVTYLTVDHWLDEPPPELRNVAVVPLVSSSQIYGESRRRVWPIVSFGAAVARHLVQFGSSYDVVHTAVLSPGAARAVVTLARAGGYLPVLDWWEVWGKSGWRSYLGYLGGEVAARLEQRLASSTHLPVVFSQLHARRLAALRGRDDALLMTGIHPGAQLPHDATPASPYILLANRLIPEKQTAAILPALRIAREDHPDLRAVIVGSGPLERQLQAQIAEMGLGDSVCVRKNVDDVDLARLMQHALCLVLLSRREGYGLVATEAARFGTPAVVLAHPDSAASERITAGENGVLVESLDPRELASAILDLRAAGQPFREGTLAWRARHDSELNIEHSLPTLISNYLQGTGERRSAGWRSARP